MMFKKFLVISALVLVFLPSCQSDSGDAGRSVTGEAVVQATVMEMIDGSGNEIENGYTLSRASIVIPSITLSGDVYPGITLSGTLNSLSLDPPELCGKVKVTFKNFLYEGCIVNGDLTDDFTVNIVISEAKEISTGKLTIVINGDMFLSGIVNGPVKFTDLALSVEGENVTVSSGKLSILGNEVDPSSLF